MNANDISQIRERLAVIETHNIDMRRNFEDFKKVVIERMMAAGRVEERVALIEQQRIANIERFENQSRYINEEISRLEKYMIEKHVEDSQRFLDDVARLSATVKDHNAKIIEYEKYKFSLTVLYPLGSILVGVILSVLFSNADILKHWFVVKP